MRTWIYVRDIHRNYDGLNRARNQFFTEQGLTRLPASTGIEGFLADTRSPVAMDLYAVAENEQVRVEAADPGLMGEASAYGASFARACQITEPGRTDVYVSGTASVGADGEVVSVGDIGGQLDCMFRNVEAVLAHAGMDLHDTLSATVYLKSAEDQAAFVRACAAHGLSAEVPTAIVVAAICRPAWLCEIELLAARVVASG